MAPPPQTFKLNNGKDMPSVLYGSYKSNGEDGVKAMVYAIDEAGYRGIDTALFYKNHDDVRQVLQTMKTPRDEVIVQTKIWPTQMRDPAKYLDIALKELDTPYIDVFMIHWPIPLKGEQQVDEDWDFIKTWKLMEELPKDKVKAIGVSNFNVSQLKRLLEVAKIPPVVNQCEFHPKFPQQELVDFCLKNNVIPQAYRPLAKGQVNNPAVDAIAAKHNCDAGQVVLSWNVLRGVCVLPKSTTDSRIKSNITLVSLDNDDIQKITKIGEVPERTCLSNGIYGYDIFNDK